MLGRFVRLVQSLLWGVVLLAVFVASAYLSFNLFIRRGAMTVPELAGLTAEEVNALATRVGERIALDGELRAHIDALAFTIVGPA